jgi:hypothetical protein
VTLDTGSTRYTEQKHPLPTPGPEPRQSRHWLRLGDREVQSCRQRSPVCIRPGVFLSWQDLVSIYLSSFRQMLQQYLKIDHIHFSTFSINHVQSHTTIRILLYIMYTVR